MADLEQAIADKCGRSLRPHKNVLSAAEIDEVLQEMGPVQSEAAADAAAGASNRPNADPKPGGAAGAAPKRLYQIREGAIISGGCDGLAANLNVDVTTAPLAFVLFQLLPARIWTLLCRT